MVAVVKKATQEKEAQTKKMAREKGPNELPGAGSADGRQKT
jgi:hypothetical protein